LQLTAKGDWGELNFLRLAFLSRAWSEQGEPVVADANWRSAVNQAGDRVGALNELLNLARRWGRINAQADLLDRILRRYPDATWAQQALEQLYLNTGDTRKLYQLYARLLARAPQNVTLKNNLTAAALLLKTNLTQAGQWAAELYAQQPADPVIVSTYAFARHLQGSEAQGLAALQKLTPAQLEQPAIALYYGVLLTATGDRGQGDYFLTRAESAGHLLPEEKALVAEARQKTN
jgi:tetratricopeptide (TPR) repeat protein